jgi:hypothetical protein
MTALGIADPRAWSISDLLPHLAGPARRRKATWRIRSSRLRASRDSAGGSAQPPATKHRQL